MAPRFDANPHPAKEPDLRQLGWWIDEWVTAEVRRN
jgi:hypothetical protein